MTKKMNRRTFILGAVVSGVSLYIANWWFFKVRINDISDIVVALVQKKLNYLQIDEAGLREFANEYQQTLSESANQRLSWMGMFSPLYDYTSLLDSTPVVENFSEIISQQFLLSSDFFWNGSDINRVVYYVGFYDPHTNFCSNPFAQL